MTPNDERELAEAVASASQPLAVHGGGTRPVGRPVEGEPLSAAGLSGIVRYEPEALTLVASAGTPLAEIESALAEHRQRLAFEPMDHRGLLGTDGEPTIGGAVAANANGPRRIQAGACRDHLLGVRFVDGTGAVVKNGGRVMKNVTGYDLVRLLAGSFGTLGVLTEIAIKVLPEPECAAAVLINGLSDGDAVRTLSLALSSPFEVTGAAHVPVGVDGHPVTMIRLEGFEDSVRYRSAQLQTMLSDFGDIHIETDQDNVAAGWRWVRDAQLFHGRGGDVWRLSVKPGDGPGIAAEIQGQTEAGILYDWGGGLIWTCLAEGADLRSLCGPIRGHATLVRAGPETRCRLPVFHPPSEPVRRLSEQLRLRFDPRRILNPGLMD